MDSYLPGQTSGVLINIFVLLPIDILALLINLLVVTIFIHYRHSLLKSINNMFLFSMALADLSVGVFGILNQILKYIFLVKGDMKSMDTWKLLGVLPFFGSAFMSVFSIGIMTADRLLSVENALRYNLTMTTFRAQMLIVLTWSATAVTLLIQGIIYFVISPETEWTIRLYLLGIFVFVGGTFLVITNAKLYLIVDARLKGLVRINSKRMKNQCGLNQNGENSTTKSDSLTNMVAGSKSKNDQEESTPRVSAMTDYTIMTNSMADCTKMTNHDENTSMRMTTQNNPVQNGKGSMRMAKGGAAGNSIFYGSLPGSTESLTIKKANTLTPRKSKQYNIPLINRDSVNKSRVCIWMAALFVICWTPFAVYCLIVVTTEFKGTMNLSTFLIGLASANSIFNPLVYFAKREHFRGYFLKFYCRKHLTERKSIHIENETHI